MCDRVRLTPVKVSLPPEFVAAQRPEPQAGAPFVTVTGVIPAWPGADAVHADGALLLLDADGRARDVLGGEAGREISSVVFDGRHVWASAKRGKGVYVVNQAGEVVAHVTQELGLPAGFVQMPLHPLAEGRVLAAGAITHYGRGWLATIELAGDGGKPRVNMFHEAVKAWDAEPQAPQILDPHMRIDPEWIVEHRDERGKRWLFVDRKLTPLVVDAETLEVSVYPYESFYRGPRFPRRLGPVWGFHSHDGMLYVAGSNTFKVFRLDPETRVLTEAAERPVQYWGGNAGNSVIVHEGFVYYAGHHRWGRHDLKTGRDETLVGNSRSLPAYGSGTGWTFSVSRNRGLVAWSAGQIFAVGVPPSADASPAEPPVP